MPDDGALHAEWRLPHAPSAAAKARRLIRGRLTGLAEADLLDDAILVADELVSNAVVHAPPHHDGTIGLRVTLVDDVVRIAVTDGGHRFDWAAAEPSLERPGGLGLHFVDRLSARWGLAQDGIKAVWCEVDVRRRRARRRSTA